MAEFTQRTTQPRSAPMLRQPCVKATGLKRAREVSLRQAESQENFENYVETLSNPFQKIKQPGARTLHERSTHGRSKEPSGAVTPGALEEVTRSEDILNETPRIIQEISEEGENHLRQEMALAEDPETMLRIVNRYCADAVIADEALVIFIEEETDPTRKAMLLEAREMHLDRHREAILAGRNIAPVIRDPANKALGTPSSLRGLYQDVVYTQRSVPALFLSLAEKYPFQQLKSVVRFLVNSLHRDARADTPSREPLELLEIGKQVQNMSAVLGVYRFFLDSEKSLKKLFQIYNAPWPPSLNFEASARSFMAVLAEGYPIATGVQQKLMGVGLVSPISQLLVTYEWLRAVRLVAPRIFQGQQHKEQVLQAMTDLAEMLENKMEQAVRDDVKAKVAAAAAEREKARTVEDAQKGLSGPRAAEGSAGEGARGQKRTSKVRDTMKANIATAAAERQTSRREETPPSA